MAKYLYQASYVGEGIKGLLAEGATSRVDYVKSLITGMGGTVEAFYFSFGDDDVVAIGDFPDNKTAAAFTLAVNASGAVKIKTTVLMTPEEVDEATRKTVNYRPPGK
ncbi:GYD domain-containing protein [Thermodesulfobacteriota bacterium]